MEGRAPKLSSVEVRLAAPADVHLLADIERAAGERFREVGLGDVADHPPPPETLLAQAQRRGNLWVATVDEVLVGYAWGVDVYGQPHLEQVSVRPEYGGRGVGAALVEAVSTWAASLGASSLTLSTFRDVPWNGPWYRRLGFAEVSDPDDDPRWRMLRAHEAESGLDVTARVIMARPVVASDAPSPAGDPS